MKKIYTRKRARRSMVHTAFYRGVSQVATMLGYIVLVRAMLEWEFGILSLMYAALPVVSAIASFGLEQTLKRYQPEYLRSGNAPAAHRLFRVVGLSRLGSTTAVVAIMLLAWNSFAPYFQLAPYRLQFMVFSLIVILHFQVSIHTISLASYMLHRFSVGMQAAMAVTKLIAYVLITTFGTLDLETAIVADLTGYFVAWCGLRYAHYRFCRPPPGASEFRFDAAERRRLLRFGFFNNLNDAGVLAINSRIDNFFIAALMNAVSVGAFSFYTRLVLMTQRILPIRMFENVVQPMFFSIPAQEAAERTPRYFTALLNTSLIVQLPMAAFVTAYHQEIVAVLFAGKFIAYSWLLPMVFAFATINVVAIPVTLVAQHTERTAMLFLSKIFAIYNIGALLVLVPIWGVYGAALATGTAEIFKNLFVWWHVRRHARWLNAWSMIGLTVLVWGSTIGLAYAMKQAMNTPPLLDLAAGAALFAISSLIFIRSPALSQTDREVLASVLHGREAKALRWLGLLPARG